MSRTLSVRLAALVAAAWLAVLPVRVEAQKALVYCPVGIDATGCNAIVAALAADATLFPGGVDAAFDGTSGTVDLAAVDLTGYAAFLVPSLADGPDDQPYALLRNGTIAGRLREAFMGRAAAWSGTPDRGSANRSAKDALIRNLAGWVKADSAGTHGPGVVVLQDNSDDVAGRYGWVSAISGLSVATDTTLEVYANVQVLTATGRTILTNSAGAQIGYSNMASFGLVGAPGTRSDATGGRSARVVLVTAAGDPADASIATVQTDKDDYFPPDTVVVTGAGWEPGETVSLLFHEDLDPPTLPDVTLSAIADEAGHILNQQFVIDSTHVGARFILTATGLTSGRTAQTTFTDANKTSFALTAAGNEIATFGAVASNACVAGFAQGRQGGNLDNTTTGTVALSSTPAGATFFATGNCSGSPITSLTFTNQSAVQFSFQIAASGTFTINGNGDWSNNSNDATATVTTNKQNQTISFTSTAPTGALVGGTYAAAATATSGLTVTFGTSTAAVCSSGGANGATISFVAAGTCTVTANQAGDAAFNPAPQVTQTFTVFTGTTTTVTSSVNPSNVGQSVTFTATVRTTANVLVGAGSVTFIEGGTCAAPGTVLKPATAVSAGVVTFATTTLTAGQHVVTACYGGTTTFAASSGNVSQRVNALPVITGVPATATIPELAAYTFEANATDADVPADPLTFSLVGAPAGAAIDPSTGVFTWTPTEAQGPGTYPFAVRVSDGIGNTDAAITLTVSEANQAPALAAIGNRTVNELVALTFTATATDEDVPAQSLSFTLDAGAPAGAAITSAGAFSWTPTEAQGPGDYPVTVRVSDGVADDFETISVHVDEVNQAPVVTAIADQTVDELATLTFTATAADGDQPAQSLTFDLVGAPTGASITPAGGFSWTPTEAQGPGVYTFQVRATDNFTTPAAGTTTVKVTVNEVNEPPVLAAIGNQTTNELVQLAFTATATDPDLPANTLSFSLDAGAPAGAAITSAGAFTWTPTEAQGPGDYPVTVRVSDGTVSDFETISIHVDEVNQAPVVTAIPDQTVDELATLTFTAAATDADLPANSFSFSLSGEPDGAAINPTTGAFAWTPTEAQGPGIYTFQVVATDNGTPALAGQTTVKVTVNEVNVAPELTAIGDKTVDEETALTFTATATDPDLPANTLTYALVGAPAGAGINASSGAFSWTPSEAQGSGTYTFTVKVTDDGTPALSDEEEITVTVNEVNVAPELTAIGNKSVDELAPLAFTATATDHDLPANGLTFSLDAGAPAGAAITAAGAFTWTPTEAQGPGDYPVTVRVTDDGSPSLSDSETITIHVNEVNVAPVLAAIGNRSVDEETALTFTASATDADLPANTLTFSLVGGPDGATIDPSSGAFAWTPSEAQGPGNYTFKVRVADNGTPALANDEEITVAVSEVNRTPVLAAIADKTSPWGAAVAFTASGSDPDLPANTLTYSLRPGAPAAASINSSTGAFTWTPGIPDVGPHAITVRVTDNGNPVMFAEQSFTITVQKHLTSVVYSGAITGVYGSLAGLQASLTDVTTGTPLSGKNISFTLGALGTSATTQSGGMAGLATTSLSLAQNVGAYSVVSTFAEEAGYTGSSDTDPFSITPAPLNVKADNKTMFYGAVTRPPFTVVYTGFVLGQNNGVLGGALTFVGPAASVNGSSLVGNYTITPAGLSSTNYTISYNDGTLAVIYNNVAGHQFLQPINPNLTTGNRSSFKIGSTIPAKFQLFKADGVTPVTVAVARLKVFFLDPTPDNPVNEDVLTLPPDTGDLFKITGGEYHYNIGTKGWQPGTYRVTAQLDDGSEVSAVIDGRSR